MNLEDFLKERSEPVNESIIIGTILAAAILAQACAPMVVAGFEAKKAKNEKQTTNMWDFFMSFRNKKDDQKDDQKDKDTTDEPENDDTTTEPKKDNKKEEAFNTLLMLASESNKKEKDANAKKKNDQMIKLLTACSFDKDGKEIPIEERIEKFKDIVPENQREQFAKDVEKTYNENKDSKEFQEALQKAASSVKPEDYDKYMEDAKKTAKSALEQIEKEKQELEEYENKLKELEEQLKDDPKDAEDLKKQKEELLSNPPETMISTATGTSPVSEPKKDDDATQEPEKDDDATSEPKKDDDATQEPKKDDDATQEPKKDDDGNIVKDEEVTDPETGKKIKVKTHTGPRGGKFYYPDGKPKKPENKVYVESLCDYLKKSIL